MNSMILTILALLLAQQSTLVLEISGIEEIKGTIVYAVYDRDHEFLSTSAVYGGSIEITGSMASSSIKLPYGIYAISVFHDLDSDGELNTKIFGIPKEPVGFSNNARGSFGPPSFDDASFEFSHDQQVIRIEID